MEQKKKVRFRYFIDKPFQTKFILTFVSIILIGMVITIGTLWYYSQTKFKDGLYFKQETEIVKTPDGKLEARPVKVNTFNRLQLFWKPVVFVSVFYIVLIIVFGLFYSHRMAGPLYRILRELERAIDGEKIDMIKLRKKDHFQNLADLISRLLQKFNK